jgi:UDP-N-acetylmuramate--alanine ligase
MLKGIKRIHLVGIGGIGMSAIAQVLLEQGYEVSGSDLVRTKITGRIKERGAKIYIGHRESNIHNPDLVIFSSAIKNSNPELKAARKDGIPILRRAEMLGLLTQDKEVIAVAGTHGKTTTASLVGAILHKSGLDPTIILGGNVGYLGNSNARLGKSKYAVLEADEFERSFLELSPQVAVITNLEREHLDCYKNLGEIKKAFLKFIGKIPPSGSLIICLDEPGIQALLPQIERSYITYGLGNYTSGAREISEATVSNSCRVSVRTNKWSPQATGKRRKPSGQTLDFWARDIQFSNFSTNFKVMKKKKEIGTLTLSLPGVHNVKNALAGVAVGEKLGISFSQIKAALEEFKGVERRFQVKGRAKEILIVDDYAHHPTEVSATLRGAKKGWKGRIIAVFQPHLYTRTRDFYLQFARSLIPADILIITDIYPAREEPLPGIRGELIAGKIKDYGKKEVNYFEDKEKIPDFLIKILQPGDLVITLGAGDIWKIGEELLKKLS